VPGLAFTKYRCEFVNLFCIYVKFCICHGMPSFADFLVYFVAFVDISELLVIE